MAIHHHRAFTYYQFRNYQTESPVLILISISHFGNPATSKPATSKAIPKKDKKPSELGVKLRRSWPMFVGGLLVVLGGLLLLLIGNVAKNAALIMLGAAIAGGGGFLVYYGWQKFDTRVVTVKGKVKVKTANCLVISQGAVEFVEESEEKLLGTPKKCQNDGKYYNVHFKGLDGNGSLAAFTLPDADPLDQYYDPKEALNCLRMEVTKKYFNYAPGTSGIISMIVMGVVIAIEVIGLVALGGK